jgi:alpha-beta hydrolase superfamily lysophospholipase
LRPAAAGCVLLALAVAGCGGTHRTLDASARKLPSLSARCGGHATATVGWFRASDGVLLDGATLGSGRTGVVLAHESPADLCGWLPFAQTLDRAGFRVLLFDHRQHGLSASPTNPPKAGRFTPDLEGAVEELKREGAAKVFLMGASFGGVTSIVAGSRLGSEIAGVVSASGEAGLPNRYGGPEAELDALAAVPKLQAPFLIVGSREDGYLPPSDARELLQRAGSAHKRLVLFGGDYHGWDLFSRSPDNARATAVVVHFLRRYGG